MYEIVKGAIEREGLIVIVRRLYGEALMKLAGALNDGGVKLMEVTFDQADPDCLNKTAEAIRSLNALMAGRMTFGAGTVLTPEQVRVAGAAGAQFIISPNADPQVIAETRRLKLVSIPGTMTPSEMMLAANCGADFIKLFPAGDLGLKYLKNVRAPLSHLKFIATAGVTLDNFEDWLRAGCVGAGVSGALTKRELVDAGDWQELTNRAKAFCGIVTKVRGEAKEARQGK